jgi:hypothetical protein
MALAHAISAETVGEATRPGVAGLRPGAGGRADAAQPASASAALSISEVNRKEASGVHLKESVADLIYFMTFRLVYRLRVMTDPDRLFLVLLRPYDTTLARTRPRLPLDPLSPALRALRARRKSSP